MNRELERNPRKALGKGLSALLPARPAHGHVPPSQQPPEPAPAAKAALPEHFEDFQSIPIDQIEPGRGQPREAFDPEKLEELTQSIRANGLIQPITVSKLPSGKYQIVAGERRWRAAQLAGLKEIPALVRTVEREKQLELALIENIQREDLNPIEIATAFQRLVTEHGLSHEQIAERTGKDRSTVTNFLRLLRLSPFVRQEIIAKQFSVRETEVFVKRLTDSAAPKGSASLPAKEPKPLDPNVRAALDEMARALGTRVRLVAKSATAGRLEIEYYSQDDLDRIYSVIVKG